MVVRKVERVGRLIFDERRDEPGTHVLDDDSEYLMSFPVI